MIVISNKLTILFNQLQPIIAARQRPIEPQLKTINNRLVLNPLFDGLMDRIN